MFLCDDNKQTISLLVAEPFDWYANSYSCKHVSVLDCCCHYTMIMCVRVLRCSLNVNEQNLSGREREGERE